MELGRLSSQVFELLFLSFVGCYARPFFGFVELTTKEWGRSFLYPEGKHLNQKGGWGTPGDRSSFDALKVGLSYVKERRVRLSSIMLFLTWLLELLKVLKVILHAKTPSISLFHILSLSSDSQLSSPSSHTTQFVCACFFLSSSDSLLLCILFLLHLRFLSQKRITTSFPIPFFRDAPYWLSGSSSYLTPVYLSSPSYSPDSKFA